jgi:pSer/pThr/pTyr-binding forkhead associated (FHA) protein
MSSTMLYALIAAGVVFLGLLILFIVMLMKPKPALAPPAPSPVAETIRPKMQDTIRPTARTVVPPPAPAPVPAPAPALDTSKTTKIPSPPVPDKTQVFMSLGADLVVEKGPDRGREFTLHLPVTTVGRAGGRRNDVEFADETVSKDQASIYYDSSTKLFSIANESTTNPTKVNGQAISGPTSLDHGALIEMGRTVVRFRKS